MFENRIISFANLQNSGCFYNIPILLCIFEERNYQTMKLRIKLLATLFTAISLQAIAQIPQKEVKLSDITFVRQSFVRNFYSSAKIMSQINMEGTNLFLPNSANLIVEHTGAAPKLEQRGRVLDIKATEGASLATIRVGAFHPYLTYEASFDNIDKGEAVGVAFYPNGGDGDVIRTLYRGDKIVSVLVSGGEEKILAEKATTQSKDIALRVQYTGVRFHVFRLYDDGRAELLYSVKQDKRAVENLITTSFGIVAELTAQGTVTLTKAQSLLTCGTGQADPQIIQTTDGKPLIRDGRLYVCFTTRGFEQIPDSYQGVYSLDIDSYELRLEGALFFGKGDGIMYGFHATKVVYDPDKEEYLVMTTTHGDTHTIAYCSTKSDILHGIHFLECKELDFPHNYTRGKELNIKFNTEDPDFFYDSEAKKWRLAYCALKDKSYVTYLCESDKWNGAYTLIAESSKNNNTGIRITTVGGRRYVLSGGSDTTFYIYDYPTLRYEGTFNQQYANGGFRGWPTIVPVPYGNYERYLWITFDRGAQTGRYSYGTLYFYLGDKMWQRE